MTARPDPATFDVSPGNIVCFDTPSTAVSREAKSPIALKIAMLAGLAVGLLLVPGLQERELVQSASLVASQLGAELAAADRLAMQQSIALTARN